MTSRTVLVAAVAAVLGGGVVVAGAGAWALAETFLTAPVVHSDCDVDATRSGFQGWCVEHHQRDGLFVDHDQVAIVAVRDGSHDARRTVAPFPFIGSDGYTVTFGTDEITLTSTKGLTVTYPASYYANDTR
ncbi:MAG: hypothetical protein FWF02_12430 [Micrococcales bacterium]|nr:hypothetical protein [Micrococcales bacterium]MCL2668484.1 hypothetical protein [Micrococcales bacterium]